MSLVNKYTIQRHKAAVTRKRHLVLVLPAVGRAQLVYNINRLFFVRLHSEASCPTKTYLLLVVLFTGIYYPEALLHFVAKNVVCTIAILTGTPYNNRNA